MPLLVALAILGCDGETRLLVDLRTDLVAGTEIDEAVTTVDRPAGIEPLHHALSREDDLLSGVRVADLAGLSGEVALRVAVHGRGVEILSRPVRVRVSGRRALTVTLSRDCRGVTCPAGDDPTAIACVGGSCRRDDCTEDADLPGCDDECAAHADCGSADVCATPRCRDGVCLLAGDDAACPPGQVCVPAIGCRPAGDPPPDAVLLSSFADLGPLAGLAAGQAGSSYLFTAAHDTADCAVARLSPDGQLSWARHFGTDAAEVPGGLAADASGVTLVATSDVGDAQDMLVVGFDPAGRERFARLVGTPAAESAARVAIAPDRDLVVTGTAAADDSTMHVTRLSQLADVVRWSRRYGGTDSMLPQLVLVDGPDVVVGGISGSFPPDGGSRCLVVLLDGATGDVRWARTLGRSGSACLAGAFAPDGDVVLGGISSAVPDRLFLARLTRDGDVVFERTYAETTSGLDMAPAAVIAREGDDLVFARLGPSNASFLLAIQADGFTSLGALDVPTALGMVALGGGRFAIAAMESSTPVWSRVRLEPIEGCGSWGPVPAAAEMTVEDTSQPIDPLLLARGDLGPLESRPVSVAMARELAPPLVVCGP